MRGFLLNWVPPLRLPADEDYDTVFAPGAYVAEMSWQEFVFWQWRVAALTVDWSITAEWPGFVGFPGPYTQSGTFTFYKGYRFTIDPDNPSGVYENDTQFLTDREYAASLGLYYYQRGLGFDVSKDWQGWEGRHLTTDGASTGDANVSWCKGNRDLSFPTMTVASALNLNVTIGTPGGWGAGFTNATDVADIVTTATSSLEGIDLRPPGATFLHEPEMHGVAPDPSILISGFINVTASAFYEWRGDDGPRYRSSDGIVITP